jgi:hypothetical protein
MFVHLCQRYDGKVDDRKSHDATRRTKKPDVDLLALGSFHMIARDLTFDDLDELNGISATANCACFFSFVPRLAGLSSSFIVIPRTADELQHGVLDLYRIVGLPVCTGSADCVRVFWDTCPANLQSGCNGKEKFLSVVFEVVASHTNKMLSVSGVQYGTDNDRIILRSDSAIWCIQKEGNVLKNTTFKYYKDDGSVADEHGYFYMVDRGCNI